MADRDAPRERSLFGTIAALAGAAVAVLYLLNPTGGFVELIPDNVPVFGNIDEVAMTGLLLTCLRHLGLDLTRLGGGRSSGKIEDDGDS